MILQEYLTKLGWSIDEPSMKRFFGAVASTSARTAELGSVAVETAGAIEAMVTRIARKYETLYYVSQRTNQSVKYIQATQFAFKNIGLSAEDANSSIENMAATLRTQPWLKAIFGGATTPQAVAANLGKSGLPYFLQARFAEMIGMDEKTLLHLQRFSDIEASASARMVQRQKAAGVDPAKWAEDSAAFGRKLNDLEASLEVFGDKMAMDFLEPTKQAVIWLTKASDWLARVDNATKGWTGTLIGLGGTAGGLLVVEKILRRMMGLKGATATGGALKFAGRGAMGIGRGGAFGAMAAVLGLVKSDDPEVKNYLREKLGPLLYELGLSKSPDLTGDTPAGTPPSPEGALEDTDAPKAPGLRNGPSRPATGRPGGAGGDRTQQVIDALVAAGYPLASAQGIVAGLHSESNLDPGNVNPTSGAAGLAQWLGPRAKKFRETFNEDIKDSTFEEQLQFLLKELETSEAGAGKVLKAGGMPARDAAGTFIHLFERPGAQGELSDMSRAGPMADRLSQLTQQQGNVGGDTTHITLNSKTTVNTTAPGADVMSTAKAYGQAHDQANENLLRNIQGVMR
jgi:Phage tail lysozyme